MEKVLEKEKSERYDFSNKESQRLFEEFTNLLAEITERVETSENSERIPVRGNLSSYRSRELLREIYNRFVDFLKDKKRRLLQKFRKNNLKPD